MDTNQLQQSVDFIKNKIETIPSIAVILGSGLGTFADKLTHQTIITCQEIPHYPVSTVPGHEGRLYFGKLNGIDVLAVKGRVHLYEGYSTHQVTYSVQIMSYLGINSLIVTNAAGGVNTNFSPGDLMLIIDHINFTFENPLIGLKLDDEANRFVDMSEPYYRSYLNLAEHVAAEMDIPLQKGVLFVSKGPCYETAAEIRMAKTLGADAVTMSTVPEVIMAVHKGMKVLGISCITNLATGISDHVLDHKEVTITANKIRDKFVLLVSEIIKAVYHFHQIERVSK